jgi:hypothetical protein
VYPNKVLVEKNLVRIAYSVSAIRAEERYKAEWHHYVNWSSHRLACIALEKVQLRQTILSNAPFSAATPTAHHFRVGIGKAMETYNLYENIRVPTHWTPSQKQIYERT